MGLAVSNNRTDRSQMVCGTLLDGFLGQLHEHRGVLVTDPVNFADRNQHLVAGEPVPGFDDELTDGPTLSSIIKSQTWPMIPSLAWRW